MQLANSAGTAVATGNVNINADTQWHWIELLFNANGAQRQALYWDGIVQWDGAYTCLAGTNSIGQFLISTYNNESVLFDDIMAYGNTGAPTASNFPLGPQRIDTTRAASDGVVNFATLSAGTTHFSLINETFPDGDTSYVQDTTSGNQDLLNYGALPITPVSITGVMANCYVENPSAGSKNIGQVCSSSSVLATGSSIVAPTAYRTIQQDFSTDPNTSAAWTASGLNAAQFGYKVA
jgi:hypothetical protein